MASTDDTIIVNNNNGDNVGDAENGIAEPNQHKKKEVDMQLQRFDDVSLSILGVRLQDKLDRLTMPEDHLEVSNFVCDCGKPLKQNAFFPCAVQAYLSSTVNVEVFKKMLTTYIDKESKKKNATEEDKLLASYMESDSLKKNPLKVVSYEECELEDKKTMRLENGNRDDKDVLGIDSLENKEMTYIQNNCDMKSVDDVDNLLKSFIENKPKTDSISTSHTKEDTCMNPISHPGSKKQSVDEVSARSDNDRISKRAKSKRKSKPPKVYTASERSAIDDALANLLSHLNKANPKTKAKNPAEPSGARPPRRAKVAKVKLTRRVARRGGARRRRGSSIATRGRRRGAQPQGRSRRLEAPATRRHCRCALALCKRIHALLLALVRDSKSEAAPKAKNNKKYKKKNLKGFDQKSEDVVDESVSVELDSDETRELEEFERQERWASNEEYFSLNADIFAESSCTFDAGSLSTYERSSEISICYDELLDPSDEEVSEDEMRGDQRSAANAATNSEDRRHNKDVTKLKSSIKKVPRKSKKNRVTFNENKNEFFEADYIILIREECQYDEESDEGICTCSQHEMVRLTCCDNECNGYEREPAGCGPPGEFVDQVTLSPPEGYKDSGLFNQDGTFKDQSFFAREGPGLIVSEGTGAVFTPQHLRQLQVIQRLQREQLRRARASLVADAEAGVHVDEQLAETVHTDESAQERGFPEKDRTKGFYAKEIVAGEERPKVNSGQQTTPTDDEGQLYTGESVPTRSVSDARISKENSSSASEENGSQEQHGQPLPVDSSPIRLGGILKGGRLWKSTDGLKPETQPQIDTEESGNYSNSASDEEGRANRAVRFSEPPPRDPNADPQQQDSEDAPKSHLALTFRLGNHLLSNNSLRPNSAVRQLFPAGPHLVTPPQRTEDEKRYLVTTESLRAFEEAKRSRLPSTYRDEDLTIRRNIDRNTLRRSLIKVDPRKKTPPKNDTSLTERIKMLTCNIDDEEAEPEQEQEQERISPSNEEPRQTPAPSIKSFSPSSSSSASSCSSTSSTYKKLTEIFPKRQECISECNEEGSNVVIIPQSSDKICETQNPQDRRQYLAKIMPCNTNKSGERLSLSSTGTEFSLTDIEASLDMPAPDVLAGTPGAGDGDELARFVQQDAARTERLRRRYQPSAENSDEDDQDDYGFQRRPSVRGIKPRFGSTNEILQQMQAQLQMGTSTPTTRPGHVSWPYYSESNLTQPAQHDHALHNPEGMHTSRSSTEDFQQNLKMGSTAELANQSTRDCYDLRNHNVPEHMQHVEHMQHLQHAQHKRVHDDSIYQNCVTYANIRCSVGERDLYSSQSSLVPIGSMPHMAQGYDSQQRNHRRPESPPPIRSYHQTMVLIPYSNLHQPHYSNTMDRSYTHAHAMAGEQNGSHPYQHQSVNDQQPTLLKLSQAPQQLVGIPFPQAGVPMQITCSAPAAHIRTVPSRPVARHMICYSEKVEAPMYQAAPGSPVAVRGAPEGAPAPAASPTVPHNYPPHNSLYYAMNV